MLYQESPEAGRVALLLWTTTTVQLNLPIKNFKLPSNRISFDHFNLTLVNVRQSHWLYVAALVDVRIGRKLRRQQLRCVLVKNTRLLPETTAIKSPRAIVLERRGYYPTTILRPTAMNFQQVVNYASKIPARYTQSSPLTLAKT